MYAETIPVGKDQREPEVYIAFNKTEKMLSALAEAVASLDARTQFARRALPNEDSRDKEAALANHRSSLADRVYSIHDALNSLRCRVNQIVEEIEI